MYCFLSPTDSARCKGVSSLPGNASFPSKFFQVGKVGPTARTWRSIQHLGKPIHHAFFMESMRALLVARPNNFFSNFIIAEANGATVGHGMQGSLGVTQNQNTIRCCFQVCVAHFTVIGLACSFGMFFLSFEIGFGDNLYRQITTVTCKRLVRRWGISF